jgi:hypothetical protein
MVVCVLPVAALCVLAATSLMRWPGHLFPSHGGGASSPSGSYHANVGAGGLGGMRGMPLGAAAVARGGRLSGDSSIVPTDGCNFPPVRAAQRYNVAEHGTVPARVALVSVAHNVAEEFPYRTVADTALQFSAATVIVYENDSDDASCFALRQWGAELEGRSIKNGASTVRVVIVCETLQAPGRPRRPRTERLADARNSAMHALRLVEDGALDIPNAGSPTLATHTPAMFDAVVWFDADFPEAAWSPADVAHTVVAIGTGELPWDIVCANGMFNNVDWHYDRFALRARGWYNFTPPAPGLPPLTPGDAGDHNVCFDPLLPQPGLVYPVNSCFGGLAVYARHALLAQCPYSGAGGDCEHAVMHACLADHGVGRIGVSTALPLRYPFNVHWRTELGTLQNTPKWGAMAPVRVDDTAQWHRLRPAEVGWRSWLTGWWDTAVVRRLPSGHR